MRTLSQRWHDWRQPTETPDGLLIPGAFRLKAYTPSVALLLIGLIPGFHPLISMGALTFSLTIIGQRYMRQFYLAGERYGVLLGHRATIIDIGMKASEGIDPVEYVSRVVFWDLPNDTADHEREAVEMVRRTMGPDSEMRRAVQARMAQRESGES